MHAAQPQQPRRAAVSAAVPLEYFQCVYSHSTQSASNSCYHTANERLASRHTFQPLFEEPIRSKVLPAAAASIQSAEQKPQTFSSTAVAQHLQQGA